MHRSVIILTGCSGIGKSFWADKTYDSNPKLVEIVSTDEFFYDKNDNYNFDPRLLGDAHASAIKHFVELVSGHSAIRKVVVDNTNTTIAEISPYHTVGRAYGWKVDILFHYVEPTEENFQILAKRSRHNIPLDTIQRQNYNVMKTMDHLPKLWQGHASFIKVDLNKQDHE